MICYSNDGYSMRAVDNDYIAKDDEVLFIDCATIEELNETFPLYNSGVPILTKSQKITALNDEYDLQRSELERYLNLAVNRLQDIEFANSVREQLDQLDLEYNQKAEAILNG